MGPEQTATRAAVVELKAERVVVGEAYDFLDEKRLLLAAELLKQLTRYEQLVAELQGLNARARQTLLAALKRHGLDGLSVYPAVPASQSLLQAEHNLMGVTLLDTELKTLSPAKEETPTPCNPSTEAEQCKPVFQALVSLSSVLAGVAGNLQRLLLEYRSTERRARALENVILPEIEETLKRMNAYLEEVDLEDAIRARPRAN